ncbi:MAG TPA: hypothetical protein VNH11_00760 [Pirellulales bacterium]|nr:hypothetical protein [Pirellulales bacterium]
MTICCASPPSAAAQSPLAVRPSTIVFSAQTVPSPSGIRENSGTTPDAAPTSHEAGYPSANPPRWSVLARSLEDRAIEYRQFGQGETQVLVVGPLGGDETAALALVEQLAEHLERFPRGVSGVRVTLVRDPNPDGRLRRSPLNARGVRLDRNFATRGWHKLPSGSIWLSGREPDSEAETRALADLISDLRPDRVMILAATRRNAELVYAGPADEPAREFAKASGLRPVPLNAAAEQGSLAVYTGIDRKLPTLVVRVPAALRGDQLWSMYKRALLAALSDGNTAAVPVRRDGEKAAGPPAPTGNAFARRADAPRATAVLATTKRPPQQESSGPATGPRTLTADELQSGGELMPIVRSTAQATQPTPRIRKPAVPRTPVAPLRRQFGPVSPQGTIVAPTLSFSQSGPARSGLPRPSSGSDGLGRSAHGKFPSAALFRSNTSGAHSSVPSMAPPPEASPMRSNVIERLPTVDAASSPRQTLPQPIPFYPETGS